MKNIITMSFSIMLIGCSAITGGSYDIKINSFSEGNGNKNKSYYLFSEDDSLNINDLEYRSYVRSLEEMLLTKGFVKAESKETANVGIAFGYNVGEPTTKISSVPIYGYDSHYYRYHRSYYNTRYHRTGYGFQGYDVRTTTRYTQMLSLTGVNPKDFKTMKNFEVYWAVTATIENKTGDFRSVIKPMALAAIDYIGIDSGQERNVKISKNDLRLE